MEPIKIRNTEKGDKGGTIFDEISDNYENDLFYRLFLFPTEPNVPDIDRLTNEGFIFPPSTDVPQIKAVFSGFRTAYGIYTGDFSDSVRNGSSGKEDLLCIDGENIMTYGGRYSRIFILKNPFSIPYKCFLNYKRYSRYTEYSVLSMLEIIKGIGKKLKNRYYRKGIFSIKTLAEFDGNFFDKAEDVLEKIVKRDYLALLKLGVPPHRLLFCLDPSSLLFLDIETVGMGSDSSVFMIGLLTLDYDKTRRCYIPSVEIAVAPDLSAERTLMEYFYRKYSRYTAVVTFYGNKYDVPLLTERCKKYIPDLSEWFPVGIDLYPILRRLHYSRLIKLDGLSLRSVVKNLLNFIPEGDINGSDVPLYYKRYNRDAVNSPYSAYRNFLLPVIKHNYYDVIVLPALYMKILSIEYGLLSAKICGRKKYCGDIMFEIFGRT